MGSNPIGSTIRNKMKKITIELTREEALSLGLLVCKCGHPPNNHFSFDNKPCAHCKCVEYKEIARKGRLKK
ncbi:MAG: hypothetical protein ACXAC5_04885 [Promethearchaeota archaeon]